MVGRYILNHPAQGWVPIANIQGACTLGLGGSGVFFGGVKRKPLTLSCTKPLKLSGCSPHSQTPGESQFLVNLVNLPH